MTLRPFLITTVGSSMMAEHTIPDQIPIGDRRMLSRNSPMKNPTVTVGQAASRTRRDGRVCSEHQTLLNGCLVSYYDSTASFALRHRLLCHCLQTWLNDDERHLSGMPNMRSPVQKKSRAFNSAIISPAKFPRINIVRTKGSGEVVGSDLAENACVCWKSRADRVTITWHLL